MDGHIMFGYTLSNIDGSGFPEMAKFSLSCLVAEPMKTHVHRFEAFAGNVVGDNAMRRCIVILHERGWLFVAHFFKSMPNGTSLAAVDEEGGKFGLCSRGHDGLMIWAMFMTALLLDGVPVSLDTKKCPPAQL